MGLLPIHPGEFREDLHLQGSVEISAGAFQAGDHTYQLCNLDWQQ